MSRPISVREKAILYLRKGKASDSTTLGGGNVLLNAGKHALGGPEHTGQLPATRVSIVDADGNYAATNVETALDEVAENIEAHLADATDAHDASAILFVPTGTIAATNVQDAIVEAAAEGGTSAADTSLWRPVMDGAGNVVTDGATGEAIMAYGPA